MENIQLMPHILGKTPKRLFSIIFKITRVEIMEKKLKWIRLQIEKCRKLEQTHVRKRKLETRESEQKLETRANKS